MTQAEALEFFKGTEVSFSSFWKNRFTFEGEKDGILISVDFNHTNGAYDAEYAAAEAFNPTEEPGYFRSAPSGNSDPERNGKECYFFEFEM